MVQIYKILIQYNLTALEENRWLELVECGIIDPYTMLLQAKMIKEQKVKSVHKYAITTLADGRVGTWVQDESLKNKRKNIKANSYEKMIDKLFDFYFQSKEESALRLCDIFEEWLEYKSKKKNNSEETIKQNRASYAKYVSGSRINTIPLRSMKTIDLENWAIDVLINNNMTAKAFNTNKIIVTGPLRYAKRQGWITENPWNKDELEYTHLFRSERIKPSADMIFYPDEIEELISEFERGFANNGNIANLGLKGNFELGLRIGELCALKWSDINWQNETIFIQRMEDSTGNVVEYVKSDSEAGYRELNLSDELLDIFKRIRRNSKLLSEFIFVKCDGSRAEKMVFVHRLEKAELALGWNTKGNMKRSHCIRRTVASRMDAMGWTLEEIRRWLGHTTTSTTLKYIYNPFRESETKRKVKNLSILHTNKECLQLSSKNDDNFGTKKILEAL